MHTSAVARLVSIFPWVGRTAHKLLTYLAKYLGQVCAAASRKCGGFGRRGPALNGIGGYVLPWEVSRYVSSVYYLLPWLSGNTVEQMSA